MMAFPLTDPLSEDRNALGWSALMGADRVVSAARRLRLATLAALVIASASTARVYASCAFQTIVDQILGADVIAAGAVTTVDLGDNQITFRPAVIYKGALESGATKVRTGPLPDQAASR